MDMVSVSASVGRSEDEGSVDTVGEAGVSPSDRVGGDATTWVCGVCRCGAGGAATEGVGVAHMGAGDVDITTRLSCDCGVAVVVVVAVIVGSTDPSWGGIAVGASALGALDMTVALDGSTVDAGTSGQSLGVTMFSGTKVSVTRVGSAWSVAVAPVSMPVREGVASWGAGVSEGGSGQRCSMALMGELVGQLQVRRASDMLGGTARG